MASVKSCFRVVARSAVAAVLFAVSCDDAEDTVERACRVVVEECGVGPSMSHCLDLMGTLPPDCIACIADEDCGYPTCERTPGCRLDGLLPD